MMSLFDEEQILNSYVESERYDVVKEKAAFMLKKGKISIDDISECFPELLENDIKELGAEIM